MVVMLMIIGKRQIVKVTRHHMQIRNVHWDTRYMYCTNLEDKAPSRASHTTHLCWKPELRYCNRYCVTKHLTTTRPATFVPLLPRHAETLLSIP